MNEAKKSAQTDTLCGLPYFVYTFPPFIYIGRLFVQNQPLPCNITPQLRFFCTMNYYHYLFAVGGLLLAQTASAQDAISSGEIRYEVTRRIDLSQVRMNVNGQEVRPGRTMPNGQPFDMPQTTTFGQSLLFANGMAMEKSEMGNGVRTIRMGGNGGGGGNDGSPRDDNPEREQRRADRQTMRNNRPFENEAFIDMSSQTRIIVLGIKKDSLTTDYYRNDVPIVRDSTWKEDDKTRKIAGYKCQKATANLKNTPYTIWYTTELPLTYSPVPSLTPDKGVVLQIESDQEAYKATKIDPKPIDEATLRPNKKAQLVSKKAMEEIRRKAMASFRQRMMAENPMRN